IEGVVPCGRRVLDLLEHVDIEAGEDRRDDGVVFTARLWLDRQDLVLLGDLVDLARGDVGKELAPADLLRLARGAEPRVQQGRDATDVFKDDEEGIGSWDRIRTCDLAIMSRLLYH